MGILCLFCALLGLCVFLSAQLSASTSVSMEGIAQLLTLAPVMWGGLECSVKQVYSHCKTTIGI